MTTLTGPFQMKFGTSAEWASSIVPLRVGEQGFDTTVKRVKVGDGVTLFPNLPWQTPDSVTIQKLEELAAAVAGATSPTDAATAANIADTGSATRAALNSAIAGEVDPVAANAARSVGFGAPQHEDGAVYTYPNRIDFGAIEPPTLVANTPAARNIDLIAHWYNDFGLESVASSSSSANGWHGWYDWRWNFPTNSGDGVTSLGYDPQRHPLMGFYKGDDKNVLDWQSRWLAEAGVSAVSLVHSTGADPSTWDDPADKCHWMYQLLNNTPNFQALKWIMWLATGSSADYNAAYTPGDGNHPVEKQWEKVVQVYSQYQGGYTYIEDGVPYAVVFTWDGELLRGAWDNYSGTSKTRAALKWLSEKFKEIGFGGVCVVASRASSGLVEDESLRRDGVLYLRGGYSDTYNDPAGVTTWTLVNNASGGTFTLSVNGATSAPIAGNASASTIESALNAISGVSGVTVTGTSSKTVTFPTKTTLTADGSNVSGGSVTVSQTGKYDNSFASYAERAGFPTDSGVVPVVQTSAKTQYPHPSTFALAGSTPQLFAKALRRAASSVVRHGQRRMLFINNVSEWAESGPGLIPNKHDGFGYLDAVRSLPAQPVDAKFASSGVVYETTISADTASVTLPVPSGARRVRVLFEGAGTLGDNLLARFNGDTGSNYDSEVMQASAGTPASSEHFGETSARVGRVGGSTVVANAVEVVIANASGFHRAWYSSGVRKGGTDTTQITSFRNAGSWRNAAKISSVTLFPASGSLRAGSYFAVIID